MSNRRSRVLLVANTSWYLYNFRLPIARALRARGFEPILLSPRDAYSSKILDLGFEWKELPMAGNKLNPFSELRTVAIFIWTYLKERPVSVHHFTIKCVIYGTFSAVLTGVPYRINAVTGLGHVFVARSWKAGLLRPTLKLAYRALLGARHSRVIFQNPDDRKVFVDAGLVAAQSTRLIRGSGVDLSAFTPQPSSPSAMVRVIFASRLLREKGIVELMEAIRILRKSGQAGNVAFTVAGDTSAGNPSAISPAQIDEWRNEGLADFLGHVEGVVKLLLAHDIVVLPSYREGTPRILLEACALEKPVVTTDVPGCREVVEDGVNGILVPARDSHHLAQAILRLVSDPSLRARMGKAGRQKMVAEFSDLEVARQTVAIYDELGVFDKIRP